MNDQEMPPFPLVPVRDTKGGRLDQGFHFAREPGFTDEQNK